MNELSDSQNIQVRIYRARGQHILLDMDLACLYGVETRILNRAVMRNRDHFPLDFMFELSRHEVMRISQIGISSQLKFSKRVLAFTEEGVAMLSGILRSPRAVQVNIAIMRAFVKLRHAILTHQGIARRVERLEGKVAIHDTDIRLLVQEFNEQKRKPQLLEKSPPVKGFSQD